MRSGECKPDCELCGHPAVYADRVPDAAVPGYTPAEAGYRLQPLCWLHAIERREVATARLGHVLRCESQGLARLDRDRCGGGVTCEQCGRLYYDHPADRDYPFLTVLCDGSVAKL